MAKKKQKVQHPLEALALLAKRFGKRTSSDVAEAIAFLERTIAAAPSPTLPEEPTIAAGSFSILRMLRDFLARYDHHFLKRQQTYHVAGSADIPYIRADAVQVRLVLERLVGFSASRAPVGGRIEIAVTETTFEKRKGVEVTISAKDSTLRGMDRVEFLRSLYTKGSADDPAGVMTFSRQLIAAQRGQLWCEVGKRHTVHYHLFLPVAEETRAAASTGQTFRFDIILSNYKLIRKSFGIKKAEGLLRHIESSVRSLIRDPLDVVIASLEEGMITVIYEAGPGAAESVSGRISRRLREENFRIGRRDVTLEFRYTLTVMSEVPSAL